MILERKEMHSCTRLPLDSSYPHPSSEVINQEEAMMHYVRLPSRCYLDG